MTFWHSLVSQKMGHVCITLLWVFLTLVLTTAITTSILSPVWFKNDKELENEKSVGSKVLTFGLLRSCRRDQLDDVLFQCDFYDIFNDKHSITWIICGSLFCIGLLLFAMCALLLVCGVCLNRSSSIKYRGGLTYIQGVGVFFLCTGVLLYPIGLNSDYAHKVCGNSAIYRAGDCQVAWGYVLIIMAVLLTIFCPILGKFSIGTKSLQYMMYDSQSDMFSTSSTTKVMTAV